jgi:hypothetical protein
MLQRYSPRLLPVDARELIMVHDRIEHAQKFDLGATAVWPFACHYFLPVMPQSLT